MTVSSQSIVGAVVAVPVILNPELAAADTVVTVPTLSTPGWAVVYAVSFVSIRPLIAVSDFCVAAIVIFLFVLSGLIVTLEPATNSTTSLSPNVTSVDPDFALIFWFVSV